MGGKSGGQDSRYTDLAVVIALLIAVVGAYGYYSGKLATETTTTAQIVPSQSTRW
ncbi:MAG: hypothetical protein J0H40_20900 [Rhizobiales bacterium]|nr:hypothetical protein [Hyphomicrobiales bacterium]